jgi:hypothetical protein
VRPTIAPRVIIDSTVHLHAQTLQGLLLGFKKAHAHAQLSNELKKLQRAHWQSQAVISINHQVQSSTRSHKQSSSAVTDDVMQQKSVLKKKLPPQPERTHILVVHTPRALRGRLFSPFSLKEALN